MKPGAAFIAALAALAAPIAPAVAAPAISNERATIAAVDERPILYPVDRPAGGRPVPLVIVIDGSGCLGTERPKVAGPMAPSAVDPTAFARLRFEPCVDPTAAAAAASCSAAFLRG